MRIYKLLDKTKISALWIITGVILATLLIFPTECRNGAANGVFLCLQVLIPSLFPFMIISAFISSSGMALKIPKFAARIIKGTFDLSPCCLIAIILSLTGGYPVGAASVKVLYDKKLISESDAKRMAVFCVSSGPGFLVTYIGAGMTRNLRLGYLLLLSQIITFFILGIISRFVIKADDNSSTEANRSYTFSNKEALVYSVDSAIKSCSKMCALVVIFGSLSEIFISLCNNNPSLIWLTALLEITNGTKIITDGYPATLLSAVCGFGGLCVHFQIFANLGRINYSKSIFCIFRILQGIINALITAILVKLFPISQTVFSSVADTSEPVFYTTSLGCVVLVLVCMAFLVSIKSKELAKHIINK